MDKGIYALHGDSTPASEDLERVPVASPVVAVFVEPVPAIAEEVGVEPHPHLTILVPLLANPVKHCIK